MYKRQEIYPAIATHQYAIGHQNHEVPHQVNLEVPIESIEFPTSFFTWASVDDELHAEIKSKLNPNNIPASKYTSGDNIWITHCIGSKKEIELLQIFVQKKKNLPVDTKFNIKSPSKT